MKHSNIPIFIPELACPHQCIFCNQSKISGQLSIPQPEDVPSIVEAHLKTMNDGREVEIAFFGGSFTGIPYSLQEQYLAQAYKYVEDGRVSSIRLSTRPDYINDKILSLLKQYGVGTIEIGAQSTNDDVLLASGRGHKSEAIKSASEAILKKGFHLGLQMMIGLPHDTFERAMQTACDIISIGADNTRIYPTLVIKGTHLARLYEQGRYKPLDLQTAVEWTKEIYLLFEKSNLKILRVGLHASEELTYDHSLVAGPYHRSFKELVMSSIWADILSKELQQFSDTKLLLRINPSQINFAWGYKGSNKKLFKNKGLDVKIQSDSKLPKYSIITSQI